jgi:putative hemolysin
MTIFLLSVGIALSVSAICSLMEAALLSLTPRQISDITAANPKLGATWQGFKTHIENPIASILVLNTAAHTIGASVAGSRFSELFGDDWLFVFSLVLTYLMLQFTEILPKTIGVHYNVTIAPFIARPLGVMIAVMRPFLYLIHWVNRPFEGRRRATESPATVEEITALAGLARLSNQIGAHQERIIRGAARLSRMKAKELMIPVDQVIFLSTDLSVSDALLAAHADAHTRFPVCEGNDRDRVVGYLNFKELVYFMRTNPQDPSLRGIIRPMHFVPATAAAADVLKDFVEQHVHIAVVRDPHDRTLGLITFEDLTEELVGELEDEFDRLPRMVQSLSGGTWMVGGGVPMSEVNARLGFTLVQADANLSTWVTERLGRPPRRGDVISEEGATVTVRRTRRGKVFEAAVSRPTKNTT